MSGVNRSADTAAAAVGLLLVSPLLLVLAVLVRIIHGPPVLFRQVRAGLGGQPFTILKLRTMNDATGPDGALLPDDARLTPFGRFLRSTSMDELPELWNVLRGEMSIVGPRPLPIRYLARYTDREQRRHQVRPGITGLAQVSGRNLVGWDQRLELDVRYVETRTIALDLRILAATVAQVFLRRGISAEDGTTMAELRLTQDVDDPSARS
jgi:sugar transferase EpsL